MHHSRKHSNGNKNVVSALGVTGHRIRVEKETHAPPFQKKPLEVLFLRTCPRRIQSLGSVETDFRNSGFCSLREKMQYREIVSKQVFLLK